MAKAGAPKKAKPKPRLTDKEQSERFIETVRKLGVDESGKQFEETFKKITKSLSLFSIGGPNSVF
jgi:hypothetical protein